MQVQIAGPPRVNAAAKDSEWITQRQVLFQDLAQDRIEEVILISPTGELVRLCILYNVEEVFSSVDGWPN